MLPCLEAVTWTEHTFHGSPEKEALLVQGGVRERLFLVKSVDSMQKMSESR